MTIPLGKSGSGWSRLGPRKTFLGNRIYVLPVFTKVRGWSKTRRAQARPGIRLNLFRYNRDGLLEVDVWVFGSSNTRNMQATQIGLS
jgi:hypothetical protein